ILLVIIIWPVAVILISFFFGQYKFFSGYVRRLFIKVGIVRSSESGVMNHESGSDTELTAPDSRLPTQIALFASGAGSNAQKIIDHFRNSSLAKISLMVCNKPGAGVLQIAKKENIPSLIIEKERFF